MGNFAAWLLGQVVSKHFRGIDMAWLFQDTRQKKKHGKKAVWSVGWVDPESGKKSSKAVGTKTAAKEEKKRIEGAIANGTFQAQSRDTWQQFRAEYEKKRFPRLAIDSQEKVRYVFDTFERIIKPNKMRAIKQKTIDDFILRRSQEPGKRPNSKVSPATINIELRTLKAALGVAVDWEYLRQRPKMEMLKTSSKIIRPVTEDHFAAMYESCSVAKRPSDGNHMPADWWRAFLVTAYLTGWRLRELLFLERRNIDVDKCVAILRAEGTKGKRSESVDLNPHVVGHMQTVFGFSDYVFPIGDCQTSRRFLYDEFAAIQEAAGIKLQCVTEGKHDCTDSCFRYGFHDLRRGFATQNEGRVSDQSLQRLMRHKSFATTQKYIEMARKTRKAADDIFVPDVLKKPKTGS